MREIGFYRTTSGRSPVEEFLESLTGKQAFDGSRLVVLVSGFAKKTQKTPLQEIARAEERRRDYLSRKRIDE